MNSLSLEEVAVQADVDAEYVRRLIVLGALEPGNGDHPYRPSDVRRVQLLGSWEAAGFSAEAVVNLLRAGELSVFWLDAPVMTRAERLDLSYEQLCRKEGVPFALLRALHGALGFAAPEPHEHARAGDPDLVSLVRMLRTEGVPLARTLGVVRVYADILRRVARAEAELYESQLERPRRRLGWTEQQLLEHGARSGDHLIACLERVLLGVYRRQREHVWLEHCIAHAEVALERGGLRAAASAPYAICFVDLTGYTRVTEERGDEVAAHLAANLTALVEDVSRCHGGRAIRWLGDGGMFHFREPAAAVLAGLDMIERAPRIGLPPVHVGVHTGPVIFQDGDVYGRTVNLASRIASHARAGQVLASDETVTRSAGRGVRFEPLGTVSLKGISHPVALHWAVRVSPSGSPDRAP